MPSLSARSKSAFSPPAMIASDPSAAPALPPDTGASRWPTPRSASQAACSLAIFGGIEAMSMNTAPRFMCVGRTAVEEHLAHHRAAVEDRQDVVGVLDALRRAVGHRGAGLGQRVGLGAGAVPHGRGESGLDQIGGHRRAHDAGAEKCDVSHRTGPLLLAING
jgi:hypothetical protein